MLKQEIASDIGFGHMLVWFQAMEKLSSTLVFECKICQKKSNNLNSQSICDRCKPILKDIKSYEQHLKSGKEYLIGDTITGNEIKVY